MAKPDWEAGPASNARTHPIRFFDDQGNPTRPPVIPADEADELHQRLREGSVSVAEFCERQGWQYKPI